MTWWNRRPAYPVWKGQVEMLLARPIESGGMTELLWKLYDRRLTPEQTAVEFVHYLDTPKPARRKK